MIKKIWKDPVWSKVIAAGLIAIFTILVSYFLNLWPHIQMLLKQVWSFVISKTNTPNWLLFLMFVPSVLFITALVGELKNRVTKQISFTDYTKDNFDGLLWSWRYRGKAIVDLHSLCPKCQYQILPKVEHDYQRGGLIYNYSCDECGYKIKPPSLDPHQLEQKIELKIQKKLRTGEWAEENA